MHVSMNVVPVGLNATFRNSVRSTDNEMTVNLYKPIRSTLGARVSVLGLRTMLQAGRSPVPVPDEVFFLFN
jgi:hypothetical protein